MYSSKASYNSPENNNFKRTKRHQNIKPVLKACFIKLIRCDDELLSLKANPTERNKIANPKIHSIHKMKSQKQVKKQKNISGATNGLRQIQKRSENGRFSCDVCKKSFFKKQNFIVHYRIHTGERPFACTTCSKTFSRKYHLTRHNHIHTGELPFPCSMCPKRFRRYDKLTEHIRCHLKEKYFKCSKCLRGFSTSTNLKKHMQIHAEGKPYQCSQCAKRLSTKQNLTNHEKLHANDKIVK